MYPQPVLPVLAGNPLAIAYIHRTGSKEIPWQKNRKFVSLYREQVIGLS
jgi:hypothetical protein